jgi:hypothetical protein
MFLAFWYSAIFPGALFLCSMALCVNYYTDRFSMMRSWKRAPRVSTEISTYSRRYFFSSACVVLVCMSAFYWAAWPFDNLCVANEDAMSASNWTNPAYFGTYEFNFTRYILSGEIVTESVELTGDNTYYRFCNQDFILNPSGPRFPFFYREGETDWMTEDQIRLSLIFGWTSVGAICFMFIRLTRTILKWLKAQFFNVYDVSIFCSQ